MNEGRAAIVRCDGAAGSISISNPSSSASEPPKQFTFDSVYDHTNTQRAIYEETALPIVRAAMEGYNGTVFCYGQTGTGKTHTMEGSSAVPDERGIIPNAFDTVFADIDASEASNKTFLVRASFLEIYNENVRDLLAKDQSKTCELKETPDRGVYVNGLTTFVVKSAQEMHNILQVGKKNRSVGATLMNADSSRSHSIFTITVETSRVRPGDPPGAEPHITVGKLNLVDLAGSERVSLTGATGKRLDESKKINQSLSALGNVISALADISMGKAKKGAHVPYRDSQLTRMLQQALGGNSSTIMVCAIRPGHLYYEETLSTLKYADRAKKIKNKPTINESPQDKLIRELMEENKKLKAGIAPGSGGGDDPEAAAKLAEAEERMR